jgi:hypothetical protein
MRSKGLSFAFLLAIAASLLALSTMTLGQTPHRQDASSNASRYLFSTISYGAYYTQALGINSAGSVVGDYGNTASFKVASDTFMTAIVPAGATTGPVVVTTRTGPLTSNVNFRITQ